MKKEKIPKHIVDREYNNIQIAVKIAEQRKAEEIFKDIEETLWYKGYKNKHWLKLKQKHGVK